MTKLFGHFKNILVYDRKKPRQRPSFTFVYSYSRSHYSSKKL